MVGPRNWDDGWSTGLTFGVVESSMGQSYDYDAIVIGAGIVGMVSAVTANGLGKRVAVIEKRKVGGSCTNYTCIPSKTLIRLGHTNREISRLASLGLLPGNTPNLDSRNVMAHIRSVVKRAYEKDIPETFEEIGITMVSGAAAFVDRHHIQVNGQACRRRASSLLWGPGLLFLLSPELPT
jgi:pyruvate/2-oxoglutarate dehydrogenase complex dihydrolipoamide dehydrogenase (E3) component